MSTKGIITRAIRLMAIGLFLSDGPLSIKIEAWRIDYNENRPHTYLGNQTPEQYETEWQLSRTRRREILNFRLDQGWGETHRLEKHEYTPDRSMGAGHYCFNAIGFYQPL